MKSIIDGRLYNTATARKVATRMFIPLRDEPWWEEESLFELPKGGEFFLHGEGGWRSCFPRPIIQPVMEWQARDWAERYLPAGECLALFGDESLGLYGGDKV